jgi:serine/threonine-protein kinase
MHSLTMTGTVLGTAGYLSPEQARGERAGPASDRYALGIVAWELLTGRRPFESESPTAEAAAHVNAPIPSVCERTELPCELDPVFTKALAKDPAERYPTADEFVAALRGAFADAAGPTRAQPILVPLPPPTEATRSLHRDRGVGYPPVRSRGAWPLLAALLLLGAVGGAALAYLLTRADSGSPTVVTRVQRVTTQGRITTVEKQVTVTTAAASTSAAPPSSGASGAALNDAGFRKMQAGDYAGALPLLERAVQRLQGTGSLTEAYADYNLASTRVHLGSCDGVLELLDRSESIQGQRDPIDRLRQEC